jgi:hypothetical protein
LKAKLESQRINPDSPLNMLEAPCQVILCMRRIEMIPRMWYDFSEVDEPFSGDPETVVQYVTVSGWVRKL